MRRIKQALSPQFFLELLKGNGKVTGSVRRHALSIKLIRAVPREYRHTSGGNDLHPVCRCKAQTGGAGTEHHTAQCCAGILQGKIMMARGIDLII